MKSTENYHFGQCNLSIHKVSWDPLWMMTMYMSRKMITYLKGLSVSLRVMSICLCVCKVLSSPPIFDRVHLSVCLFVTFYPHHQFNQAECCRREARCWEHPPTPIHSALESRRAEDNFACRQFFTAEAKRTPKSAKMCPLVWLGAAWTVAWISPLRLGYLNLS